MFSLFRSVCGDLPILHSSGWMWEVADNLVLAAVVGWTVTCVSSCYLCFLTLQLVQSAPEGPLYGAWICLGLLALHTPRRAARAVSLFQMTVFLVFTSSLLRGRPWLYVSASWPEWYMVYHNNVVHDARACSVLLSLPVCTKAGNGYGSADLSIKSMGIWFRINQDIHSDPGI